MTISAKSLFLSTAASAVVAFGMLTLDSSPAHACGGEPTIGEVCYFSYDWCPNLYLPADGRSLPVNNYQALYALIGTIYGSGSGAAGTTFNLPDLRGRTAVGTGQGPGLSNLLLAQKRGQEAVLLTPAMVPLVPHTHTATFVGTGGGGTGPMMATIPVSTDDGTVSKATANQIVYPAGLKITDADGNVTYQGPYTTTTPTSGAKIPAPVTGATGITGGTVTVAPAGSNPSAYTPTVPPQLAMTACIAVNGYYPDRP